MVGDVRSRGLGGEIEPEFYLPITQAPPAAWEWIQRTMTLVVKAEGRLEALASGHGNGISKGFVIALLLAGRIIANYRKCAPPARVEPSVL